ncbi:GNAT family N-acetyltransferase [Mobilitalea sibirica]|uniref:GNAT family N-acetyltransferase n=1 Tax=Mobilitalea sibirica TaxID=1462919 RepID=A0A8J7H733_9FIRM|nr:GNAT family N-acetyltransferase [Mobilitalea sibirica]MBH1940906.1 GNAT family N-acetyltransferase [Mobilitalea sibirica]
MEIKAIQATDELWNQAIQYANNCSWKAGPFLAKKMLNNDFSDWERVFIAVEGVNLMGYCSLVETDCIPDVSYTPYISHVFVGEEYRGKRISEHMIKAALAYAKNIGFSKVYLVSGEKGLYEKYGFTKIDDKKDYWGNEEQIFCINT